MHVRCDNQYKIGADTGTIFGQPMLFECKGVCVSSPARGSEMRGCLPADCKIFIVLKKKFSCILGWMA